VTIAAQKACEGDMKPQLIVSVPLLLVLSASSMNGQTLAVQGNHFTVGGAPKFLLFISYFDAMRREASGDANPLNTDFALFTTTVNGVPQVDGIRIFPNWWDCTDSHSCTRANGDASTDSVFDSSGQIQDATHWSGSGHDPWTRFINVLAAAQTYHLLVDVTFTKDTMSTVPSVANYQTGISNVIHRLQTDYPYVYTNVFFDVQNEWNVVGDDRHLTDSQVAGLVTEVHLQNSAAIATGSSSDTASATGTAAAADGFDVVEFHDARVTGWSTASKISGDISSVHASTTIPIVYGEPTAWQDDATASDFADAAKYAKQYGAALWTLHNRDSQNMACSGCTYTSRASSSQRSEIGNIQSAAQGTQWGASLTFTDSTLVTQTTSVKAVHFIELRSRIDALRLRFGLRPYAWTDATITPGSTTIKAVHLTELRTALSAAYTAGGQSAPAYTGSVSSGTTIAAAPVTELRSDVQWLEAR
jgi:hypothetical protein